MSMRRYLPFLLAVFCGFFAIGLVGVHIASGDAGSGSAVIVSTDPGSGSGSAVTPSAPVAAPSATLHDPTTDPMGAIADIRGAKKTWAILIVLLGLTKLATFAGGKFAPLGKWMSTGKRAMVVTAIGTLASVAYDALANGGSWFMALAAVIPAALGLVSSHAPAGAVEKHA